MIKHISKHGLKIQSEKEQLICQAVDCLEAERRLHCTLRSVIVSVVTKSAVRVRAFFLWCMFVVSQGWLI